MPSAADVARNLTRANQRLATLNPLLQQLGQSPLPALAVAPAPGGGERARRRNRDIIRGIQAKIADYDKRIEAAQKSIAAGAGKPGFFDPPTTARQNFYSTPPPNVSPPQDQTGAGIGTAALSLGVLLLLRA